MFLTTASTVAVVLRNASLYTRGHLRFHNPALPLRIRPDQICRASRCISLATHPPSVKDHNLPSLVDSPSYDKHGASGSSKPPVTLKYDSRLPVACPGCGALSQEIKANEAGYYSRSRKSVKTYLHRTRPQSSSLIGGTEQEAVSIPPLNHQPLKNTAEREPDFEQRVDPPETPVCDRCHDLIYNNKGRSIAHPSLEALADSINESPFRRNHVYHVLDAADFPMSLVPKVFKALELAKPRSQNRRARSKITGKSTLSFIITRSDLLGSSKEMVDRMMPYFQNVLRSALGREGRDMRLGNVHLVSAKRGWWTKELKNDIWDRGGGNWMVGKVNVGKSNLFPVLFPKGSGERAPIYAELYGAEDADHATETEHATLLDSDDSLEENLLLPPTQPEVPFPTMPIVSNLPGTTASPIRLSFGNHKGELIDLPGLERGNLEGHVHPEHKLDLVMQSRPTVKKHVIKPGQSLILGGGLVRITPQLDPEDRSTTMLAYPFVPLDVHVTATDKAIGSQLQQRQSGIHSILAEGAGHSMKSSGIRNLDTDVTKIHASSLLRAKVPLSRLPFRVYSSDILIEGVGWIELVCQVRRTRQSLTSTSREDTGNPVTSLNPEHIQDRHTILANSNEVAGDFKPFAGQIGLNSSDPPNPLQNVDGFAVPRVEIFSPHGSHVGQRIPLGASALWEDNKRHKAAANGARPRKSMKGVKKSQKMATRLRTSST